MLASGSWTWCNVTSTACAGRWRHSAWRRRRWSSMNIWAIAIGWRSRALARASGSCTGLISSALMSSLGALMIRCGKSPCSGSRRRGHAAAWVFLPRPCCRRGCWWRCWTHGFGIPRRLRGRPFERASPLMCGGFSARRT